MVQNYFWVPHVTPFFFALESSDAQSFLALESLDAPSFLAAHPLTGSSLSRMFIIFLLSCCHHCEAEFFSCHVVIIHCLLVRI